MSRPDFQRGDVTLCHGKFTKNIKGKKIRECDDRIAAKPDQIIGKDPEKQEQHIHKKPYKRINKNTPKNVDINLKSYQVFKGKDLPAIEGMSYNTVLAIMSEVGHDGFKKFKTALRNAANAIGNLKDSTPLRDFFHRINFRKGRVSAITARKLAVIIWNMVTKGSAYQNPEGYLYLDQKRKLGTVKRIQKQIDKFGITNDDLQIYVNQ